jgi:hypothetical protein
MTVRYTYLPDASIKTPTLKGFGCTGEPLHPFLSFANRESSCLEHRALFQSELEARLDRNVNSSFLLICGLVKLN